VGKCVDRGARSGTKRCRGDGGAGRFATSAEAGQRSALRLRVDQPSVVDPHEPIVRIGDRLAPVVPADDMAHRDFAVLMRRHVVCGQKALLVVAMGRRAGSLNAGGRSVTLPTSGPTPSSSYATTENPHVDMGPPAVRGRPALEIDHERTIRLSPKLDLVPVIWRQDGHRQPLDLLDEIGQISQQLISGSDHRATRRRAPGSASPSPTTTVRRAGAIFAERRCGRYPSRQRSKAPMGMRVIRGEIRRPGRSRRFD